MTSFKANWLREKVVLKIFMSVVATCIAMTSLDANDGNADIKKVAFIGDSISVGIGASGLMN